MTDKYEVTSETFNYLLAKRNITGGYALIDSEGMMTFYLMDLKVVRVPDEKIPLGRGKLSVKEEVEKLKEILEFKRDYYDLILKNLCEGEE